MKEKHPEVTIIGAILLMFGIFMFFKNVRLYSFDFYHIGAISTGAIIIALLFIDAILMIACYKPIMKYACFLLVGLLVLSIILGTRLHFSGSLTDLILMLAPLAAGAGFCFKGFIDGKKNG